MGGFNEVIFAFCSRFGSNFLSRIVSEPVELVSLPRKELLFDLNGRGFRGLHAEIFFEREEPVAVV